MISRPYVVLTSASTAAHLDQGLGDAGEHERAHGVGGPARPDRHDRARARWGWPCGSRKTTSMTRPPSQTLIDARWNMSASTVTIGHRRRAGVAGDRPGGHPDRAEHGQQHPVGAPALAPHDRAEPGAARRPARRAGSGARRRTDWPAPPARRPRGGRRARRRRRRAPGAPARPRWPARQPGAEPDHPDRAGPVEPLRPEHGEDQDRPDEQEQTHVADPAHHREGSPDRRARRRRRRRRPAGGPPGDGRADRVA